MCLTSVCVVQENYREGNTSLDSFMLPDPARKKKNSKDQNHNKPK